MLKYFTASLPYTPSSRATSHYQGAKHSMMSDLLLNNFASTREGLLGSGWFSSVSTSDCGSSKGFLVGSYLNERSTFTGVLSRACIRADLNDGH
ncbi:MAG TPA: hypothetical protein VK666_28215 [Chryseolinea sp.]|nr:hypothetical protein [Chryseolinea sp.]